MPKQKLNLGERISKVEVRLKYLERAVYSLLIVFMGKTGIDFIPVVSALIN